MIIYMESTLVAMLNLGMITQEGVKNLQNTGVVKQIGNLKYLVCETLS